MKKNLLLILLPAIVLTSCGTMGVMQQAQQPTQQQPVQQPSNGIVGSLLGGGGNGSQGLVGSLISGLLGNIIPMNTQSIVGTWVYDSPECRFESENFLAQAGGEIAASTVEGKMATAFEKIGIKKGACSFTFNQDGTCAVVIGGRAINGTYTVNSQTRQINIKSSTGLLSMTSTAYLSVGTLTLLFDAQKLLTLVQGVGAVTGNLNSTAGTISGLLNSYKGMQLGMNLTK